ncbi:MAG TPA: hypothetical protein VGC90_07515 [Candidatus Limnocylindrales bacterium]
MMVYVWGLLAAVQPAFRTAMDSSDVGIRVLMKLPAVAADVGLVLGVAYALRARPGWAAAAALAVALHPAVIDVGAWWGQYESVYVLAALVAYLLAVGGRPGWAAVALGVAVMTKPQALPFVVPFAAWYLARYGVRGSFRYGAVGAATVVVLWLPFVAAGGPVHYLQNLAAYQGGIFAILSLRAWNAWWLVQDAVGGGSFVGDSAAIAGPITLRMLGYIVAGLLEALVFVAVFRAPTARTLAIGIAAASLVAFAALTSMHERYAFAAVVFLALALPDARVRSIWLAFSVAYVANLLAAAPPTEAILAALPIRGPIATLGTVTILAATAAVLYVLLRASRREETSPALRGAPAAAT